MPRSGRTTALPVLPVGEKPKRRQRRTPKSIVTDATRLHVVWNKVASFNRHLDPVGDDQWSRWPRVGRLDNLGRRAFWRVGAAHADAQPNGLQAITAARKNNAKLLFPLGVSFGRLEVLGKERQS